MREEFANKHHYKANRDPSQVAHKLVDAVRVSAGPMVVTPVRYANGSRANDLKASVTTHTNWGSIHTALVLKCATHSNILLRSPRLNVWNCDSTKVAKPKM